MELFEGGYRPQRKKTSTDLLILCFVFWPLFWNLWAVIDVTNSLSAYGSVAILIGLSLLSVLLRKKLRKSYLLLWLLFFAAVLMSGMHGIRNAAILDLSVMFCGALFCMSMQDAEIDTMMIMRCLWFCGLFVSATILLDALTRVFSTTLLPIYTDYGKEVILKRGAQIATGGILPHTGNAGCFVCSGLGAYIISLQGKKWNVKNWIVIAVFFAAFLLLQKRGFLLDMILAAAAIWLFGRKFDRKLRYNPKKTTRLIAVLIAALLAAVVLYLFVAPVRETVDAMIGRFSSKDETLSGRTVLYALALKLFMTSPVFGIGWGMYREQTMGIFSGASESTYEVHSVYLQLLCEAGIIGLAVFLIAVCAMLIPAVKKYRSYLAAGEKGIGLYSCRLGIYLQLFFLAYCFSGNPLYDYNFLITYFIGILLTLQWRRPEPKNGEANEDEDWNPDILQRV